MKKKIKFLLFALTITTLTSLWIYNFIQTKGYYILFQNRYSVKNDIELNKIGEVTVSDAGDIATGTLLYYYPIYWLGIQNIESAKVIAPEFEKFIYETEYDFEKDGFLIISWGREIESLSYAKNTLIHLSEFDSFLGIPVFKSGDEDLSNIYIYQMKENVYLDNEAERAARKSHYWHYEIIITD